MVIQVGIVGATGKMGALIIEAIGARQDMIVIKTLSSRKSQQNILTSTESVEDLCKESDIIVDFSHASQTSDVIDAVKHFKKPYFLGTTGLSPQQINDLKEASQIIPILQTPNTTLGITLIKSLIEKVTKSLGLEYDIEVSEAHHRHKTDAPSGTALSLGKAACDARGINFEKVAVFSRNGDMGPRSKESIGFSVIRGGSIPGDHSIKFIGEHDMIELRHITFDRKALVSGVLKGISWLITQNPGYYTMDDVLLTE